MASLKQQIFNRLDSLKRFGESKHKAKQDYKKSAELLGLKAAPNKAIGIYSKQTCDTYKKWALNFATWEREKHPSKEYKILDNIPKEHVGEWLKESISKGNSGYTVRLQAASIAKIMECSVTNFGIEIPRKKDDIIKRSRNETKTDKHFSIKNNKDIINFAKGSGLRRSELTQITTEQVKKDSLGNVYLDFKEKEEWRKMTKGGRGRIVHVISDFKEHIWKCKTESEKENRGKVFIKINKNMDVHSYRREYAKEKYKEIEKDLSHDYETKLKKDYICRDKSGRRYNRKILERLVEDLGHTNQLSTVVNHYLK
jgi:hypothetical protein